MNGDGTSTTGAKGKGIPYWWGAMAAFASAVFFFISFILQAVRFSGAASQVKMPSIRSKDQMQRWINLEPDMLRSMWDYRAAVADMELAYDCLLTIGFFSLVLAVGALADAFELKGGGHKASKTVLVPSFIFAAIIMALDLTFNAGTTTASAWIYKSWNLDDATVRTDLEATGVRV